MGLSLKEYTGSGKFMCGHTLVYVLMMQDIMGSKDQGFSQNGVHFLKKSRKIYLISINFMGKHASWTPTFQCLAKSLFTDTQ